ncbi:Anthranilate phosphoribosyltransferase TrpD [Helicobacter ailurogastricus]|uniref:anthranilate phosphoribosyltransferase n=1 Tax=Helicobacter ailurogastricus TaxID=1578720 RepID=UPI00244D8525|nr:anthranilate phosphoribosyltransferase [Helicobacter ailurogastricus]GMB89693.1 Anthranilate phosphoribosyltransferase TrpD [Helicobacter ailurogastricus]
MPLFVDLLNQLCAKEDLQEEQVQAFFQTLLQGGFSDVELGALLVALKCKGESPQEIASSVRACLQESQALNCPFVVIDNCGTGGDGLKSFNISTISAFVCACLGVKMAKAGNYSSSGSGSAELLECLGFNIRLSPKQVSQSLDLGNFAFLFAPLFYPSFAKAAPLRKALKIRTLFNLLGPLLNPLRPKAQLLGVSDPKLCYLLACALQDLGLKRALVVHGAGSDEIALHGSTCVCELKEGEIKQYALNPSDFDLKSYPLEALQVKSVQESAQICLDLLQGGGTEAQKSSVIANTAGVLFVAGRARDFKEGARAARECLESKQAYTHLQRMIQLSHA